MGTMNMPFDTTQNNSLVLRGHHTLCLLGFQGFGYSKSFVKNMSEIHAYLLSKPESMVAVCHPVK